MPSLPTREQTEARLSEVQRQIGQRITNESLATWWSGRVAANPDNVAVRTDTSALRYRDLDALAERVAARAHELGVRPGEVVAIQLPASAAFLALILGLAKLGARLSLLGTALRGRSLAHALQEVPSRVVITTPEGSDAIAAVAKGEGPTLVALDVAAAPDDAPDDSGLAALEAWLEAAPGVEARPAFEQRPSDTLFYIFTSGTTGLPKATQCSHLRYIAGAISESVLLGMNERDCMYVVLPMFHIAALSATGAALSVGGAVAIRPRFSASRFWRDVQRFEATTFQYLGEILRYVLAQPRHRDEQPNTLRAMIGAGISTRVWQEFVERFGPVRIVESYGSSEGVIGMFNLDEVAGSVGRPPENVEERLRIVEIDEANGALVRDARGRLVECAEGEAGELISRLDDRSQFEGYTSAEATERKFIEDAFEAGDVWYRSGDAFRKEEGYYYFANRLGDTYRWKGENVSTQEVANALAACDAIEHATVYGVRVPEHEGNAGMALVSLRAGNAFDGAKLCGQLARELPPHALPLFLRIGDGKAALTDTYKLGTAVLKAQGYGEQLVDDPLFVLDQNENRYVPLDERTLDQVGLPPFEEPE